MAFNKAAKQRKQSPERLRPNMSDLRIVLLGKDVLETSRVGNFILGRDAFETGAPPPSVELHSDRASALVEGRYITLINLRHLFDTELTQEELTQRVKECVSLSDPGPHAFLMVLEPDNFTDTDRNQVNCILKSLSDDVRKYTMVVTTQKGKCKRENSDLQSVIAECDNRHFELSCRSSRTALVKMVKNIAKDNEWNAFVREEYEQAVNDVYQSKSEQRTEQSDQTEQQDYKGTTRQTVYDQTKESECEDAVTLLHKSQTTSFWKRHFSLIPSLMPSFMKPGTGQVSERLNLVLCGSDAALKTSISDLILRRREQSADPRSVCVRKGEVCGHLLTLVEMPALYNTQLSEEEVMRETLHCVSLCHPGVHAFIFIVPGLHLTDEDKGEIDIIESIFSSRINNHTIVFIAQQSEEKYLDHSLQKVIQTCGGRYEFFSTETPVQLLITCVKDLLQKNENTQYTRATYFDAQFETQLQYMKKNKNLKQQIAELEMRIRNQTQESSKSSDCLRIVLLGKTGVGKSATGNTILGKAQLFKEAMYDQSETNVCQKETAEINGKSITVIDTPGLFDTEVDNEEIKKEIIKCITLAAPGPHVFVLLLKLGQRFTQEEKDTVKLIENTFGDRASLYTIVLFTSGDTLHANIEEYVANCSRSTQYLIQKFGNRYHVVNNRKADRVQVTDLLNKINAMVASNKGSCYTNEMFQQAEKEIQEQKERILKEREKEIEREKEEMKRKHEAEMERMKRIMEEEQKEQESERRRREMEFKKREEEIRREMKEQERLEREQYNKRREEDERRMKEWMDQINREKEENRERQREEAQRWRDQEEEDRRRREEDWKEKQREEKEKFEKEKADMIEKQRDHEQKLQQEYEQKTLEEEKRRAELEEKIRHAEESKKKELLELQQVQKLESVCRMKEEEKRRDEQENMWRQTLESKEKQWTSEQQKSQQQYEQEKELEMKRRDLEEKGRKLREEEEKKRIEDEANEKIKQQQREMEQQREYEAKQREEKYQKELEKQLKTQKESFQKEEEERERARKDEEERKMSYMTEMHEEEMKRLCKKTEQAARQQAEEEFCARLDEKVKEAKTEGQKEGHSEGFKKGAESVEAQRTKLGKGIDVAVNALWDMHMGQL